MMLCDCGCLWCVVRVVLGLGKVLGVEGEVGVGGSGVGWVLGCR